MKPGQNSISNSNCHRCGQKILDRYRRFLCRACCPGDTLPGDREFVSVSDPEIATHEFRGQLYREIDTPELSDEVVRKVEDMFQQVEQEIKYEFTLKGGPVGESKESGDSGEPGDKSPGEEASEDEAEK